MGSRNPNALIKVVAAGNALLRLNEYMGPSGRPHQPHARQRLMMAAPHEDLFFGGAAGGGKSDALLLAALMYVDQPEYRALIMRRALTHLKKADGLITRSHEWLDGSRARWQGSMNRWLFPSGATLEFGFAMKHADLLQYDSAAYHFIGMDEATQFPESFIRFMRSRLRRLAGSTIPLRMRYAGNPGGESHVYFKSEFVDVRTRRTGVAYIPSRLADNPSLDQASYIRTLSHLTPVDRERKLNGDWEITDPGQVFQKYWLEQVIPSAEVPPRFEAVVRFWDRAATRKRSATHDPDYTVGLLMGLADHQLYILDVERAQIPPAQGDALMKASAQQDARRFGGPEAVHIVEEQEGGSSGPAVINQHHTLLEGFWYEGLVKRSSTLALAGPFASACKAGRVHLVEGPWVLPFQDELEAFTGDGKGHDDQVVTAVGAYRILVPVESGEPQSTGHVIASYLKTLKGKQKRANIQRDPAATKAEKHDAALAMLGQVFPEDW